ncbi:MAG: hypothetical protein ABJL99_22130 [Aliishimia sp.]
MTFLNTDLLHAYATLSDFAYIDEIFLLPDSSFAGVSGTFENVSKEIDGDFGFQARAFFNDTIDELVISFSGTEGVLDDNFDLGEFLQTRLPILA